MQPVTKQQCYHRHTPLPDKPSVYLLVAGKKQAVCCYGCQAVASALLALNPPKAPEHTELEPLVNTQ
jgi:hypothetical protein